MMLYPSCNGLLEQGAHDVITNIALLDTHLWIGWLVVTNTLAAYLHSILQE